MKIYENFRDAEASIRAHAPTILYKYRDWSVPNHKRVLTHQELWLSDPANLNDPYDVRIPLQFRQEEVDHPIFAQKLRQMMAQTKHFIDCDSREFNTVCENHHDLIRENPNKWFSDVWKQLRVSDIFNCFGVLSLSDTALTDQMWQIYGGSTDRGFCIGWNTVDLARCLNDVGLGKVWYQDEPMTHSFVDEEVEQEILKQYVKRKKYAFESEWRFITPQIEDESQRLRVFNRECVREVTLNELMPEKEQDEIKALLKEIYGSVPPIYQLVRSKTGLVLKAVKY
jgi:hypothetical protein